MRSITESKNVEAHSSLHLRQAHRLFTWRNVLGLLPILIPAVLLAILVQCSTEKAPLSDYLYGLYGCDPLGNVWVGFAPPSIWDIRYTLTITTAFGNFTFPAAKGIDVVWDLVVGRGFQAVAAWALYLFFRNMIEAQIEHEGRPYSSIIALQYSTASLTSLWAYGEYARRLLKTGREHGYLILMLVLSTIYVLSVPTFLSAMSGYQATNIPVLRLTNDSYVAMHELKRCSMIVLDGSRVGLGDNYCVPLQSSYYSGDHDTAILNYSKAIAIPLNQWRWYKSRDNSSIHEWYFDTPTTLTISGNTYHLEKPSLHFVDSTIKYDYPGATTIFSYDGRAIGFADLRDKGVCQPGKNYQWGFSFLLVFVFLIVTVLLFSVLYIIWCISKLRTTLDRTAQVFGNFRTIVEVNSLLQEKVGVGLESMTNEEIKNAVKQPDSKVVP